MEPKPIEINMDTIKGALTLLRTSLGSVPAAQADAIVKTALDMLENEFNLKPKQKNYYICRSTYPPHP